MRGQKRNTGNASERRLRWGFIVARRVEPGLRVLSLLTPHRSGSQNEMHGYGLELKDCVWRKLPMSRSAAPLSVTGKVYGEITES